MTTVNGYHALNKLKAPMDQEWAVVSYFLLNKPTDYYGMYIVLRVCSTREEADKYRQFIISLTNVREILIVPTCRWQELSTIARQNPALVDQQMALEQERALAANKHRPALEHFKMLYPDEAAWLCDLYELYRQKLALRDLQEKIQQLESQVKQHHVTEHFLTTVLRQQVAQKLQLEDIELFLEPVIIVPTTDLFDDVIAFSNPHASSIHEHACLVPLNALNFEPVEAEPLQLTSEPATPTTPHFTSSLNHNDTPTLPADNEPSPASKNLTAAAMNDATPVTDDSTSSTNDSTPATDDSTPATNDSTPATDDLTPATDDLTSATNDSTPATDDSTPATDDLTPATDDLTSATNDSTPATDDLTPATDDLTSATDDSTLATDDLTPANDDSTLATDDLTPANDDSTLANDDSILADNGSTSTTASVNSTSAPDDSTPATGGLVPTSTNSPVVVGNDLTPAKTTEQATPSNEVIRETLLSDNSTQQDKNKDGQQVDQKSISLTKETIVTAASEIEKVFSEPPLIEQRKNASSILPPPLPLGPQIAPVSVNVRKNKLSGHP